MSPPEITFWRDRRQVRVCRCSRTDCGTAADARFRAAARKRPLFLQVFVDSAAASLDNRSSTRQFIAPATLGQ